LLFAFRQTLMTKSQEPIAKGEFCTIVGKAMPPKLEYSTEELIAELERQSWQAQSMTAGLGDDALNWQPEGGKGWSVLQCLDHLLLMNRKYEKALREAVANNRDQLEPRRVPIQPSGWLIRWYIGTEEPPPKFKVPAPKKIRPLSNLTGAVVEEFCSVQQQLADFVREWGSADLGDLKVKDPIVPLHLTADTQLVLIALHNRRHLWQAANVMKAVGFPGSGG
jgi:hypothetical protein